MKTLNSMEIKQITGGMNVVSPQNSEQNPTTIAPESKENWITTLSNRFNETMIYATIPAAAILFGVLWYCCHQKPTMALKKNA